MEQIFPSLFSVYLNDHIVKLGNSNIGCRLRCRLRIHGCVWFVR